TFDDVIDEAARFSQEMQGLPNGPMPAVPPGNDVNLGYRIFRNGPISYWDRTVESQSSVFFHAAGRKDRPTDQPWRRLTIVVTPQRIEARWETTVPVGIF